MARGQAPIRRAAKVVHSFPGVVPTPVPEDSISDVPPAPPAADPTERETPISAPSDVPLMPTISGKRAVSLRPTTVNDIDQLWDWTRDDPDGVKAFLGIVHPNSRDLFQFMQGIANLQAQGLSWLHSVVDAQGLIGFLMLHPITRNEDQPPVGTVHTYLAPTVRGELPSLLPRMIAEGERLFPDMTFFVVTEQDALARLLQSHGFTRQIVLTRPASQQASHTHGS